MSRRVQVEQNSLLAVSDPHLSSVSSGEDNELVAEALLWEASISATMSELIKSLCASRSIEEISALVLDSAIFLTGSMFGSIGSLNSRTELLVRHAESTAGACQDKDGNATLGEFFELWEQAWDGGQQLGIDSSTDDSCLRRMFYRRIRRFLSMPVRLDGRPVGQIALANADHDYTEREHKLLERLADLYAIAILYENLSEQFAQAQKMEIVGQMAGSIVHDFNNYLTSIQGHSDLLLEELDEGDPRREDLQVIRKAAEQSALLARQLLTFSRRQAIQPQVLDSNEAIGNLEDVVRKVVGDDVDVFLDLEPELGWVKVGVGQLEQVIMNLAINARDAMPEGGKLTVETANVELDQVFAYQHPGAQPGSYVMLAVSDTGIGMTEEVRSRLFEPFFTTKEQGTGLGLATVYGIVKQWGGYIRVYSEPGGGTTFKVYLPRADRAVDTDNEDHLWPGSLLQSAVVLLVEDDEATRVLARHVLQEQGYTILEARNANEALVLCREYGGAIHLVITDVVMPGGMDGRHLAELLVALRPEIKVVYMSGYPDRAVLRHDVLDQDVSYVQKPFTLDALMGKVREVLAELWDSECGEQEV